MAVRPGDLVIPRVRFALNSNDVGIVLGVDRGATPIGLTWLVMWVSSDQIKFTCHFDDALLTIDEMNVHKTKERCLI